MEFIYYAQVIKKAHLNEEMKPHYNERVAANRKTSAALSAAILDLPAWYIWYLNRKGLAPGEAAKGLIGYSNATEYDQGE